jgi:proline- and glutamine-rich splicing factor
MASRAFSHNGAKLYQTGHHDGAEFGKNGNHKIFVGNIPSNTTQKELSEALTSRLPGVSVKECWVSPGNYAFILLDTRYNVIRACQELDGAEMLGRQLRVRPAYKNTAIKVLDIPSECGNRMLMKAFSVFGEVERAVVATDEKGNSLGWGLVEYARKGGVTKAVAECRERPFLIGRDAVPVRVELPIQVLLEHHFGISPTQAARLC